MKLLRRWQSACITKALDQYKSGNKHFFCQATPAAGKTHMSAELAKEMLAAQMIELVVCFAPSKEVVHGFRATFKNVLGKQFDGKLGAIGTALTYQSMDYLEEEFWSLFCTYRVLAIFDEIHHCASPECGKSNLWGEKIVQRIQNEAAFTLALSGTPWRTDELGIALAKYSSPSGQLLCDYRYSLSEAVSEEVCRSPRIVIVENEEVEVHLSSDTANETKRFDSINALLGCSDIRYHDLLSCDEAIGHLLQIANIKLDDVRVSTPDAAGLIVTSSIEHAVQVARVFRLLGQSALVVTSENIDARECINDFRKGCSRWIIAVGMVAEGTDIPRIQVCCHLSRIRTELHFRQVLGRALRRRGDSDPAAWMFVFAEPSLCQFAERLAVDLPEDLAVITRSTSTLGENKKSDLASLFESSIDDDFERSISLSQSLCGESGLDDSGYCYRRLGFSDRFRHQLLAIF